MFETTVKRNLRVLDWDLETVAAGFADPDWVPQKITCAAWSWIGEDEVHVRVCGPTGLFGNPAKRVQMLKPLLKALNQADMFTGHNLLRFDLPVLQAELMRLGMGKLPTAIPVQDTMKLLKSKGFKKGQDNLGEMLRVKMKKKAMDWQAWQDEYDRVGWPGIQERCVSDIQQHKQIRDELMERDIMQYVKKWKPR